ncbi:MAG: CcoQ/FixQ family Cbb3-type cytochrome c oxidase assembly chaperone [Bacteroidia bacterium]
MYKEVISGIKDISVYPVFSFIVFFAFFSLMTFWVLKSKKNDFDEISKIPLSGNDEQ